MRLYGVAYAMVAAMAVYRTVTGLRKLGTYKRKFALTNGGCIQAHVDIFMGFSCDTGTIVMTGTTRIIKYCPIVYYTGYPTSSDVKDTVAQLIENTVSHVNMMVHDGKYVLRCIVYPSVHRLVAPAASIPYYVDVGEGYAPSKIMPIYHQLKKALKKLPAKIYV